MDVLISNSEDKTTRIWDLTKKVEVDCFTNKELDRFWVVAVHNESFTFACGSDSALYVFSLLKERVPCTLVGRHIYVGERKSIKMIDTGSRAEVVVKALEKLSIVKDNILLDNVDQLQYNVYDRVRTQLLVRLRL
jgi:coatomer protein complex subunit alpha (xenin)